MKSRCRTRGATCTMSAAVSTWELETRWEKHQKPNKHSDDLCSDGISATPDQTSTICSGGISAPNAEAKIVPVKCSLTLTSTIICYYTRPVAYGFTVAYDFTVHDAKSQCLIGLEQKNLECELVRHPQTTEVVLSSPIISAQEIPFSIRKSASAWRRSLVGRGFASDSCSKSSHSIFESCSNSNRNVELLQH